MESSKARVIDFPKLVENYPDLIRDEVKQGFAHWLKQEQKSILSILYHGKRLDVESKLHAAFLKLTGDQKQDVIDWLAQDYGLLLRPKQIPIPVRNVTLYEIVLVSASATAPLGSSFCKIAFLPLNKTPSSS